MNVGQKPCANLVRNCRIRKPPQPDSREVNARNRLVAVYYIDSSNDEGTIDSAIARVFAIMEDGGSTVDIERMHSSAAAGAVFDERAEDG